jgi:peptide deformylase
MSNRIRFILFYLWSASSFLYSGEAPFEESMHILPIVQMGDPVLRTPARALSKEEILSPEIQQLIEQMKATMRAAPGVGLAAPQIGLPFQLIVIEDMDHTHLTAAQLLERDRQKVPFHVVINPQIYLEGEEMATFVEGCLSVPHSLGSVPRASSVRVECLNERGEPVVIEARGWYARILQHEIDHINATLFLDRVSS